jgi:hypothetical protein
MRVILPELISQSVNYKIMKIKKTIYSVITFAFLLYTYLNLVAFDDGIVGFTLKNGNKLGCVCHDFSPDNRVSVLISGPSTVFVNETATYTLQISGGPAVAAGCNIATRLGDLFPSPLDTMLRRDESFPGSGFELTHKDPKVFLDTVVVFTFEYTAPPTPNVNDTIFANGNSVNFDLTSDNDKWNFAENFIIAVIDRPLPVELSSFTSVVLNNTVELRWTTLSELNNEGFDIERSVSSGSWNKIGFIKGHGTSNVPAAYSFSDKGMKPGHYNYRLKQIDFNGNFSYYQLSNEVIVGNPDSYLLSQNYPNPFNPVTSIRYDIPQSSNVSLKVYDINGKEVMTLVDQIKEAGYYKVEFNGSNLSSGVYYYRLEVSPSNSPGAGFFVYTKKMLLLK